MKPCEYMGVRYPAPEEDIGAFLCVEPTAEAFQPQIEASIENESYGGCKLRIQATDRLQIGDRCVARVGTLSPQPATVVWRHAEEDGTLELGLKFEE